MTWKCNTFNVLETLDIAFQMTLLVRSRSQMSFLEVFQFAVSTAQLSCLCDSSTFSLRSSPIALYYARIFTNSNYCCPVPIYEFKSLIIVCDLVIGGSPDYGFVVTCDSMIKPFTLRFILSLTRKFGYLFNCDPLH